MIRAILFDVDGVLINSTATSMKRHQEIAKILGFQIPTLRLFRKHWGKIWGKDFLQSLARELNWPQGGVERFRKVYLKQYHTLKYQPFKGLDHALNALIRKKNILIILSSRDRKTMMYRLEQVGINSQLFYLIQSHHDCPFIKPDPQVFDSIIAQLQQIEIEICEIVYVGDTIAFDYKAAKNHQPPIKFIGITSGAVTKKKFMDAGLNKKHILKSAAELPSILHYL